MNDELIEKAKRATGIHQKTALVHAGLAALVRSEAARRLAAMGGTDPHLKPIPRRRSLVSDDSRG